MNSVLKDYLSRFFRLIFGLIIGSFGVSFTVNANLGLSPWDVFSQGIAFRASEMLGREILLGTVIQVVGVFVLVATILLKEKIGFGTILDILIFGYFLNFFLKTGMIPIPENIILRILLLVIGFIIWGVGIYTYMSAGLGAGPRDSLMAALTKRNVPVSIAKNATEFVVLVVGYLLGGTVGIGTVVAVFIMGYILKYIFKAFNFDIATVHNDSMMETVRNIKMALTAVKI